MLDIRDIPPPMTGMQIVPPFAQRATDAQSELRLDQSPSGVPWALLFSSISVYATK